MTARYAMLLLRRRHHRVEILVQVSLSVVVYSVATTGVATHTPGPQIATALAHQGQLVAVLTQENAKENSNVWTKEE